MKTFTFALFGISLLTLTNSFAGTFTEKSVDYQSGGKTYQGFLVVPTGVTPAKKVPGVLVIHNWMGLSDETKSKARELGKLGYVAFAADIYGKGVRPQSIEEAAKLATQYKTDRKDYREHLNLGLKELEKVPDGGNTNLRIEGIRLTSKKPDSSAERGISWV